jgi:hypothetical protein
VSGKGRVGRPAALVPGRAVSVWLSQTDEARLLELGAQLYKLGGVRVRLGTLLLAAVQRGLTELERGRK